MVRSQNLDSAYVSNAATEVGFSYLGTSPVFTMTPALGFLACQLLVAGAPWLAEPIYVGLAPELSVVALLILGGVVFLERAKDRV